MAGPKYHVWIRCSVTTGRDKVRIHATAPSRDFLTYPTSENSRPPIGLSETLVVPPTPEGWYDLDGDDLEHRLRLSVAEHGLAV